MTPETISTIVTVVFIVVAALGFLRGVIKGVIKSGVDVAFTVICTIISIIITKVFSSALMNVEVINAALDMAKENLYVESIVEYIELAQDYIVHNQSAADTVNLVMAIPTIILTPLVFILVNLVVGLVLKIPRSIMEWIVFTKPKGAAMRLTGGLVGAFRYSLVLVVFLIPLVGYLNYACNTIDVLSTTEEETVVLTSDESENGENTSIDSSVNMLSSLKDNEAVQILYVVKDSPLLQMVHVMGGEALFETFTTTTVSDVKISLSSETTGLVKLFNNGMETYEALIPFIEKINSAQPTEPDSSDGEEAPLPDDEGGEIVSASDDIGTEDGALEGEDPELEPPQDEENTENTEKTEEEKQREKEKLINALDKVNKTLEESEFLPLLLSKVISFASGELLHNGSLVVIEKPVIGGRLDSVLDELLAILESTDSDTLRKDIITLTDFVELALNEDLIEVATQPEVDVFAILEDEPLIDGALRVLYSNERTRRLIPIISDELMYYVCDVYDEINGTTTTPDEFDYEHYNEEGIDKEAHLIVCAVKEIKEFMASIEGKENVQDIIVTSDLESLGESMEIARESIVLGRQYKIIFYALLHSEGLAEFNIIDNDFIDNATAENADISSMLTSRQTLMKLILSMQSSSTEGAKQEMLHSVVEAMLTDDAESIKSLVTEENLISMGISTKNAESINNVVSSMLDAASSQEFESEEEKQEEIEKTETVLNAITNALHEDVSDNMFTQGREPGNSKMSAEDFVDSITDSSMASAMVQSASNITDSEGNVKEDPYRIQNKLSDSDKNAITDAIQNSFDNEETTEEQKATLEALATIFGVTITK